MLAQLDKRIQPFKGTKIRAANSLELRKVLDNIFINRLLHMVIYSEDSLKGTVPQNIVP